MIHKKYVETKQGNITIVSVGLIVLVIIFATVFLVYYQTNIIIQSVRQDLFYVSKNSIISFDTKDLAYRKYTVDENKTKEIIEYLLNKNYSRGAITNIEITNLDVIYEEDKVRLDTEIKVTFKSVINIAGKNEHSFRMNEQIKIALLEYN